MDDQVLSWVPRRRGEVFCAPACGGGCKWQQYHDLCVKGRKAVKSMEYPRDWRFDVSENLGWSLRLVHVPSGGRLTIHHSTVTPEEWWAMYSHDSAGCGDVEFSRQMDRCHATPQEAASGMLEAVEKYIEEIIKAAKAIGVTKYG